MPVHIPVRTCLVAHKARIHGVKKLGEVLRCFGGLDEALGDVLGEQGSWGEVAEPREGQVCCAGEAWGWVVVRSGYFWDAAEVSGSLELKGLDAEKLGGWESGVVGPVEELAEWIVPAGLELFQVGPRLLRYHLGLLLGVRMLGISCTRLVVRREISRLV